MPKNAKHAFGASANLDTALREGKIDAYDILFLDSDSKPKVGWVTKDGKVAIAESESTTDENILVNGVEGLGIPNGSTIPAGKSLNDVIKMLVQKAIPAKYTKPTVSLGNNGGQVAGDVEAGTTITPKLRASFSKNDAGDLTAITIKKGADSVTNGTTSPLDYNGEEVVVGDETITFTATADYADAPVKNDNLGNPSKDNWFGAGTVNSNAYNITGKRNMFYGTGVGDVPELTSDVVRGLSNKKLAPANGNTIEIKVAVGQQYVVFAYPSTLRDVNNVTYVEANDGGMAQNFAKTIIDVADARGGENGKMEYKSYSYHMSVPAAAPMTFKVTI